MNAAVAGRVRGARTHRFIRKLHLWIGAWGAIAAIMFGCSGFLQNHRMLMKLPQGDSREISSVELDVPEVSRASREAMREWLHGQRQMDVQIQRGGQNGRWMFAGGNARIQTQVEYVPGAATATVRKTEQSPLAVLERLHKGNSGGVVWILLSDSFAISMVTLGLSGLIMWGRGRSPRDMVFSIVGVAVVVVLIIGGIAVV